MASNAVDEELFVRERLNRGAISLIEREGCSSLGVRRLAQASDRTTMCVYTKFGSRGGLLTAVFERVSVCDARRRLRLRRFGIRFTPLGAL